MNFYAVVMKFDGLGNRLKKQRLFHVRNNPGSFFWQHAYNRTPLHEDIFTITCQEHSKIALRMRLQKLGEISTGIGDEEFTYCHTCPNNFQNGII